MPVLSRPSAAGRRGRRGPPGRARGAPPPRSWGRPREGPGKPFRARPAPPPARTTAGPRPAPAGSRPASQPQPDRPGPQSQSFSRSYGSRLPTSLTYIVLPPEAVHLGDLLRIWVRSGTKITPPSQVFQGPAGAHPTAQEPRCFTGAEGPISERIDSRAAAPLQRKENSSGSPRRRHLVRLRRRAGAPDGAPSPWPGSGILTRFPFDSETGHPRAGLRAPGESVRSSPRPALSERGSPIS